MRTANGTRSEPTPAVSYYNLLQLLNSLFDHGNTCSCNNHIVQSTPNKRQLKRTALAVSYGRPVSVQNLICHHYLCFGVQDAHGSDHSAASILRNASTIGDSVLLIVALCFHSVFEGIAIGIAGKAKPDRDRDIWMRCFVPFQLADDA
jgi:zinc transporter ZupT